MLYAKKDKKGSKMKVEGYITCSIISNITATADSCKYLFLTARAIRQPVNSFTSGVLLSEIHSSVSFPDRARAPYENKRPSKQSLASCRNRKKFGKKIINFND